MCNGTEWVFDIKNMESQLSLEKRIILISCFVIFKSFFEIWGKSSFFSTFHQKIENQWKCSFRVFFSIFPEGGFYKIQSLKTKFFTKTHKCVLKITPICFFFLRLLKILENAPKFQRKFRFFLIWLKFLRPYIFRLRILFFSRGEGDFPPPGYESQTPTILVILVIYRKCSQTCQNCTTISRSINGWLSAIASCSINLLLLDVWAFKVDDNTFPRESLGLPRENIFRHFERSYVQK